ncbi:MAG: NAD(P)H-dependent oxidoreductase [Candidatus Micrarchaeota archaeon]
MANRKACIIYSYPSKDSKHGSRLLQSTISTLDEDKIQYELIDLYSQNFNPVLSNQESLEWGKNTGEQIKNYQHILKSCQTWIFIYPSWWSTPPAILKGFLDRVLTPGFSHKIENGNAIPLLNGHQALILRTFSYSAAQEKKCSNVAKSFMESAVLNTCGVICDEIDVYSVDGLPPSAFEHILKYIPGAVRRALTTPTGVPHHLRSIQAPYLPPVQDHGDEIKAEREEKEKKLSKEALADLNYFRKASRHARETARHRPERDSPTRYKFPNNDSDFHPSGYSGREGSWRPSRGGPRRDGPRDAPRDGPGRSGPRQSPDSRRPHTHGGGKSRHHSSHQRRQH